MRKHNVPEWYIKSCEKIQYLLPKAHIVGNSLNAYREMWFRFTILKKNTYYQTRYKQHLVNKQHYDKNRFKKGNNLI